MIGAANQQGIFSSSLGEVYQTSPEKASRG
jgi:hypothetical protein